MLGRVFKNKGVVTIIAAIICIAILFFAYRYRVDKAINAEEVPIAARKIEARTQITKDMIKTTKVASSMLTNNVIRNSDKLIDKYVNYNTFIPAGSLFYTSAIVDWDSMPDSAWSNIEDNNTIVSLSVNARTTYGNSIYPGDKIDLYYQTYDNGKLVLGKLIEGINVLAVKDSNGNHIFKKSADQKSAAALIFSVPEDYHLLLKKAMYLGNGDIIPVPRSAQYNPTTSVSSKYLENLILGKCINVVPDVQSDDTLITE